VHEETRDGETHAVLRLGATIDRPRLQGGILGGDVQDEKSLGRERHGEFEDPSLTGPNGVIYHLSTTRAEGRIVDIGLVGGSFTNRLV